MAVNWNKNLVPNEVVQKIEGIVERDANGNVVSMGWGITTLSTILHSMLDFSDDVPEEIARNLTTKAIWEAAERGTVTSQRLLPIVNRLVGEYLRLPVQRYVLVSSLSLRRFDQYPLIRLGNSTIIIEQILPEKFALSGRPLRRDAAERLFSPPPQNYIPVRVFVSAKSTYEAADSALYVLGFLRGIWNWLLNRSQPLRMSHGRPEPINKIVTGPIHTLHFPNGKLATETWWYEPHYVREINPFLIPRQVHELFQGLAQVRTMLRKHQYRSDVEKAFVRYANALDERNWFTAYLKLWNLLEMLTNTTGKDGYDVSIRRASFLFDDTAYYKQVIRHLTKYRNDFVHHDKDNAEIETFMYELKNIVEALLCFHLRNKYKFPNLQEACDFLSLSTEPSVLDEKIRLYQLAKDFRKS